MSSSTDSGHSETRPIQEEIEHVYRQYQQAHLYETLDDVAGKMERQLLQTCIANELFDTDIEISTDAKQTIKETSQELGSGDLDRLEDLIETTDEQIDDERSRINKQIQESRVELHNTVEALAKLNSEIKFMDSDRLNSLETLLDDWDWEAEIDWADTGSIEERLTEAESFARRMRTIFEDASDAIGDEFEGSEVQTLVKSLLTGGGIALTELDSEQREALAESELADHIELTLG